MIWTILFFVAMFIGMLLIFNDKDEEIAAWREGKYGKAILLLLWYMLKIFIFFFFAPILVILVLFRKW